MLSGESAYRWIVKVRLADDVLHVVDVNLVAGVHQLHRWADGAHGACDGLHTPHTPVYSTAHRLTPIVSTVRI